MRKQYGMSQEQLAEKLGVSRQAVTKWETGAGIPDIENILAIATLFHLSVDGLLSGGEDTRGEAGFFYESATEYDIDAGKRCDIRVGEVCEVVLEGTDREKILVRLGSNAIGTLERDYKVKIDDHKSHIDVDVNRVGGVSGAQSKEALFVSIGIPSKFLTDLELSAVAGTLRIKNMDMRSLEFDGKANAVRLSGVKGHLQLNCSNDMDILCDDLSGRVDINQISATSTIHIPKGTAYSVKKKGNSNRVSYAADGRPAQAPGGEDAENRIELAGMSAELVIDEYTRPSREAR